MVMEELQEGAEHDFEPVQGCREHLRQEPFCRPVRVLTRFSHALQLN